MRGVLFYTETVVYFLFGPDSYRRGKKLREMVDEYKSRYRDFDLLGADLEEDPTQWEKVRDFLNQPSLFVESKVAVVKESGAMPQEEGGKEWAKVVKSFLKTEKVFIVLSDREEPSAAFSFLLGDPVKHEEFNELSGRPLEIFVKKEVELRGLALDSRALEYFLRYLFWTEGRGWAAVNGLDVIALAGFKSPVTLSDIKPLFTVAMNEEVYQIARALIFERQVTARLALLEQALIERIPDAHLFNSLGFQARGESITKLADYDIAVKSGSLEYEEALTSFAIGG